ncbi:MAG: helix-turn-helix domain-containing protein [Clostridia bacterium]|nr:helix-turn-helix domain-containing protein [Clostridia bacterium]
MKETIIRENAAFNHTFEAEGVRLSLLRNESLVPGPDYERVALHSALHTHFCYEFFYVMENSLVMHVGEKEYRMFADSFFLAHPDESHYAELDDTSASFVSFRFAVEYKNKKTEVAETVRRFLAGSTEPKMGDEGCRGLVSLLLSTMKEKHLPFCGSYLLSLLLACASIDEREEKEARMLLEDKEIYRINRIEYLCQELFTKKELTVSLLAKELHLSERQVERLIKKQYGCPLKEYVARLRIHEAVAMLKEGIGVAETAEAVGYGSLSAFYRAFHAQQGCTPGKITKRK